MISWQLIAASLRPPTSTPDGIRSVNYRLMRPIIFGEKTKSYNAVHRKTTVFSVIGDADRELCKTLSIKALLSKVCKLSYCVATK